MGEARIFAPDARVELIAGEIVDMAPIGSRHAGTVDRLARAFFRATGDCHVRIQQPLALGEDSEPVPDVVLARPRGDDYLEGHPTPADVFLIVEVADTSLAYDSDVKAPLYAKHGIPEVWVVDIARREVMRFADPQDGRFSSTVVSRSDVRLAPSLLPQAAIDLGAILA